MITQEQFNAMDNYMRELIKQQEDNMSQEEKVAKAIELRLRKAREAAQRREYVEIIADLERQIAIEEANNTQNQQIQAREITLNLDMTTNTSKPSKEVIGAIQKRIGGAKTTVTVEELANHLHNGATMKAAALNGYKNIDWESQEVFAIDIDNDEKSVAKYGYVTIEDILARCEEYNVTPAFYYTSFSHTPEHHKFR